MKELILKKFIHNGADVVDGPSWGMTTLEHGSMRYRNNETNENRISFLEELCSEGQNGGVKKKAASLELIHSKTVYEIEDTCQLKNMQGDGIITLNRDIVPVVTVADCVPIYIYDLNSGAFGVVHSGWKGTGIIGTAVSKIQEKYGSRPEDISVAVGPHIGGCCYNVSKERAEYFRGNFGSDCISKIDDANWSLSLTKANLSVLKALHIPDRNVVVYDPCTCCYKEKGVYKFGSFRRQTSVLPAEMELEEKMHRFTVQAAFVRWN